MCSIQPFVDYPKYLTGKFQVDVVYIGTIHPTHLHCVQLMLKCGKPVLCEKPLTMNVRDTSLLIENFTKSGVFLMEVSNYCSTRFNTL